MKPLPFTWPYALIFWGIFLWAYMPEMRIVRRAQREATATDEKSLQVILYGGGLVSALAFFLAWRPWLRMSAGLVVPAFFIGTAVIVAASLLRRHCFKMLATSFTGDVRARADQEVVSRGAYRYVRHPAYTAGIMLNTGIGIALGSWLSTVLMLVGAVIVYIVRMNVEEAALLKTIGEPYARFMSTRKRLVPYIYSLVGFTAFAAGMPAHANAQTPWQPAPGHTQIKIWPGAIPGAHAVQGAEVSGIVVDAKGNQQLVGGRPWIYVDKVSQPTMTVYSPAQNNTGVAVVVFPGGGYNILAIDLEGSEVCDWLTARGITCVLLKYRVPCVKTGRYRDCRTALVDAQRTVGLVRFHATQWHIDPHKIGVLGFSAGGHMVAAISTHFESRLYSAVDDADKESCRPDFAVALYPGHLAAETDNFAFNPDIKVSKRTPPTFLVQAQDDPVDPVENSLVYYGALRKAGVPAELHVFAKGGHAFGLRPTQAAITHWPELMQTWLATILKP